MSTAPETPYDAWKTAPPPEPAPLPDEFREALARLEKQAFVARESEAHAYDLVRGLMDTARFEMALEFEVGVRFPDELPEAFKKAARAALEKVLARLTP